MEVSAAVLACEGLGGFYLVEVEELELEELEL